MKTRRTHSVGSGDFGEMLAKASPLAQKDQGRDTSKLPNTLDEFRGASPETLETLMLSRMNLAANLQRDIAALVLRLAEQLADAKVAEMLLRMRSSAQQNRRGKK